MARAWQGLGLSLVSVAIFLQHAILEVRGQAGGLFGLTNQGDVRSSNPLPDLQPYIIRAKVCPNAIQK